MMAAPLLDILDICRTDLGVFVKEAANDWK
jgi:hypothetical protein